MARCLSARARDLVRRLALVCALLACGASFEADAACSPVAPGSVYAYCDTVAEATAWVMDYSSRAAGYCEYWYPGPPPETWTLVSGPTVQDDWPPPAKKVWGRWKCSGRPGDGSEVAGFVPSGNPGSSCSSSNPPIKSDSGFDGPAPTAPACFEDCEYEFKGDTFDEVCVGAGLNEACTHYGQYEPTGEQCDGGGGGGPAPDGGPPGPCVEAANGYTLCQRGPNSPPCFSGATGTHCVHGPGPACNHGQDTATCIGDDDGGPPPEPSPDPGEPEDPEGEHGADVCGVAQGRDVCLHLPAPEGEGGGGDSCPEGQTGTPPDCTPEPRCPANDPDCDEDDEDETVSDAPCGLDPSCEGDVVGCAQLLKQHKIACEVDHSNTLLNDFRNKQLSEVRETNKKLRDLQDKLAAEQKATTAAINKRAQQAQSQANESNQRLAALNSQLKRELEATRERIDKIAPDMTGPGQTTLDQLKAKMQEEIDQTEDLANLLAAQYGDQNAILDLIQSDTAQSSESLQLILTEAEKATARAEGGAAPGDCTGTYTCLGGDKECERQRALWVAICLQKNDFDAIREAVAEGAADVVDAIDDLEGGEDDDEETNSLLGTALDWLETINNTASNIALPGLGVIEGKLDSLISYAGDTNDKLASFGQDGEGGEEWEPDPSEWGEEADADDFLVDVSPDETLLDDDGYGWARTCPTLPVVTVFGTNIDMNSGVAIFCQFLAIGSQLVLVFAALVSLRIMQPGR